MLEKILVGLYMIVIGNKMGLAAIFHTKHASPPVL